MFPNLGYMGSCLFVQAKVIGSPAFDQVDITNRAIVLGHRNNWQQQINTFEEIGLLHVRPLK